MKLQWNLDKSKFKENKICSTKLGFQLTEIVGEKFDLGFSKCIIVFLLLHINRECVLFFHIFIKKMLSI